MDNWINNRVLYSINSNYGYKNRGMVNNDDDTNYKIVIMK